MQNLEELEGRLESVRRDCSALEQQVTEARRRQRREALDRLGKGRDGLRDSSEKHDEAMAELPDADDTADRLLRQKLRGWDGDEAALQRAQNYLLRRGFSWEEIRGALERYRSENEDLI